MKSVQQVLPKTKLGEAIQYSLNQWEKLVRYTLDGQLSIDNNRAERAIKVSANLSGEARANQALA